MKQLRQLNSQLDDLIINCLRPTRYFLYCKSHWGDFANYEIIDDELIVYSNDCYPKGVISQKHNLPIDNMATFRKSIESQIEKKMNFCLSGWVVILAKHFVSMYGASQGDFVTRQVISRCITQGQTLH